MTVLLFKKSTEEGQQLPKGFHSMGQQYATDAKGHSDTILITVTEGERFFYGYDELSNSWIR